ncbi:cyclic nucleotide-binding/CBS domain-containing protein [Parashewanella curva]|uniref:Cyclic nucleotide-binding/CBS domain-containing protein n=1 Tax=Parashewanella curva TaxID=2338552 RepID=A0A3L8PXW5_9GAMM|nr:DUF294 nucleotidyltransferase-like domain-containing protein [Parashewanella curva]RLV59298.1 cyclic nucleotide-binding/CBS domain-containing protein [Parashewanella curva]
MSSELTEIKTFIQATNPLDLLPEPILEKLIKQVQICYVRCDETLPPQGITDPSLYVIRKGTLSVIKNNQELIEKLAEGDICSVFCSQDAVSNTLVKADEDTLIYAISFSSLLEICVEHPHVGAFFTKPAAERLSDQVSKINEQEVVSSTLMNRSIGDFFSSPAVTIEETTSLQSAAMIMTERNFSSLLIIRDKALVGIVTDKDFRCRGLAKGLTLSAPVSDIMTADVQMIDVNASAYEALIKMNSRGIHHLPVSRKGQLAGMVTITDLMRQESLSSVNVSSMIAKAKDVTELSHISDLLPKLQVSMAKLGTSASSVGKTMSAIADAFTCKLIELAKAHLGDEPVPFVWVSAGSQARQEQMVSSDQDNALIIDDSLQEQHRPWFTQLAQFVCDGLAQCGYPYCPGDVMASNQKWRQTQAVWHKYFTQWIDKPDPKALMHCSIFFDMRSVYGKESLLEDVRQKMLKKTQGNTLFLAHLSANAIKLRPPLGFFRDFVLTDNGKHKNTLDLKHNGIAPVVDLARIYALSEGIEEVNTLKRLTQAMGTSSLTQGSGKSLFSAFEFLTMSKVKHQAKQLLEGEETDCFISPNALSKLDREHLKDAFKVIKEMQSVRQTTYG